MPGAARPNQALNFAYNHRRSNQSGEDVDSGKIVFDPKGRKLHLVPGILHG